MSSVRRLVVPVLALAGCALIGGVTGCSPAGEQPARQVAAEFSAAVGAGDADGACALLAPETTELLESMSTRDCAEALPALELPAGSVTELQVWGDAAQAHTDGDVLFLRELDEGWFVVAAGCEAREGGEPYQCALQGS